MIVGGASGLAPSAAAVARIVPVAGPLGPVEEGAALAIPAGTVRDFPVDRDLDPAQQASRLLPAFGVRLHPDPANVVFRETFAALLFDLDGTLVDSTSSVMRSWMRFAEHFGVPMERIHENHGRPARVLISRLLPEELAEEALAKITQLEVDDAVGLHPIRSARDFFESVPSARRAIVTSGSVPIASSRLSSAEIARPDVWITVEEVTNGKPHPEPFLLAAERLGVDPARCLVFEDAAAGIQAAKAAGCRVVALAGTAPAHELAAADLVIDGYDRLRVRETADGVVLDVA